MIEFLLELTLSNILAASALGSLAFVAMYFRRLAVAHALWVMVLVKLITPPVVRIPIDANAWSQNLPQSASLDFARATNSLSTIAGDEVSHGNSIDILLACLAIAWIICSLWLLLILALRTCRFKKLLGESQPGPDSLQRLTRDLSARVGLSTVPAVRITDSKISPLAYGTPFGQIILLPAGLLDRITDRGVTVIMLHELAHLRRGDHWVRLVETIVGLVFWWNPLVWIARKKIRVIEEICCDACVVSMFPDAYATYARTLIETAEFLADSYAPAATITCGFYHPAKFLRKRIIMIMRNGSGPVLKYRTGGWVFVAAFCLVPLAPTLADYKSSHSHSAVSPANEQEFVDTGDACRLPILKCQLRQRDDGTFEFVFQLKDKSSKSIPATQIASGRWLRSLEKNESLNDRRKAWMNQSKVILGK